MEVHDGAPDLTERRGDQGSSQAVLNGEEGLDDEERTRRRAERRRAKRKRQKERKKLEREERMEDASEQEEEATGAVSESDSEEDLKEEEEEWTAVRHRNKCITESVPAGVTTGNKSNGLPPHRTSDEVGGSHHSVLQNKISNETEGARKTALTLLHCVF
ncbi:inner centromere protein-like isoform X2 [Anarrhichthys ocellatus]|nr:inner centromere protein-like isoform X2 [Anarrhichthys ocellatus]